MTDKHTRGPWESITNDNGVTFAIFSGSRPLRLTTVHCNYPETDPTDKANASLMAASPELLELARAFRLFILERHSPNLLPESCLAQLRVIDDVIEKATGERPEDGEYAVFYTKEDV